MSTATPVPVPASPTPTTTVGLKTENITYSGALSVEDLNSLLLDLGDLPGVRDVQGGAQELLVTYDPKRVSHEEIVDIIKSHGYKVEESSQ